MFKKCVEHISHANTFMLFFEIYYIFIVSEQPEGRTSKN